MPARTRRASQDHELVRDQVARLAGLFSTAVDLIQSGQRDPTMVDALMAANQLFKENRLGDPTFKTQDGVLTSRYRDFFTNLREGDVWKLRDRGFLACGEYALDLPRVCEGGNELYTLQYYAQLLVELVAPIAALFTGLTFQYIRALDGEGNKLRILTQDRDAFDSDTKSPIHDELCVLYEFEFKVVRAS